MMNARWSFLAVPLLATFACSDPVPLPPEGAITLSVLQPDTVNGAACPVTGKTYTAGNPLDPANGTLIDGDKDSHIACSVKASGGGFAFSGSVAANTTAGDPYPINVTFTNGVVDATGNGTASISVYAPNLGGSFASSAACTIKVLGTPIQVKGGSIWASFSCPSITNPPSGLCQVGSNSTVVFENCDGS